MGKKGVAATSSGKTALTKEESSLAQESNEGVLTGVFHSDVQVLCSQQGIPPIAVYSRNSGNSPLFAFLVDAEVPEQESFTALDIKGWLLTDVIAKILQDALNNTSTKNLSTIHLWNVGLSASALSTIASITSDHSIRVLALDGNNLSSGMPIPDILLCKSLVKLSMKSCSLTDQFAEEISPCLSNNSTLLHLNLSCNCIGDKGCTALASSLRLNRTLLTLSLTGNFIGDSGAQALAKVLSRFALDHAEVVQRRKLLSLQYRLEEGRQQSSELQVERGRSSPRGKSSPTSTTALHKSLSKSDKMTTSKSKKVEQKKEEKIKKEESKNKRALESRKGKVAKEVVKSTKREQGSESPHTEPPPLTQLNPLLDLPVENEKGQLYLPGNTNLVYLALAYNAIGNEGMQSLLEALKLQTRYSHLGPGLIRLTLEHNNPRIDDLKIQTDNSDLVKEIASLLARKSEDGTTTEQEVTTTTDTIS